MTPREKARETCTPRDRAKAFVDGVITGQLEFEEQPLSIENLAREFCVIEQELAAANARIVETVKELKAIGDATKQHELSTGYSPLLSKIVKSIQQLILRLEPTSFPAVITHPHDGLAYVECTHQNLYKDENPMGFDMICEDCGYKVR